MSETTTGSALARALARAQGAMRAAEKDRVNPHFRSSYATLASVWEACREPLAANGLAVVQLVTAADKGSVTVETRLLHEGGESLSSTLAMPVTQPTAQGVGSAITYARRYALAALVGVAPDDDDDGNEASRRAPPTPAPPSPPRGETPHSEWERDIREARTIQELTEVGLRISKLPKPTQDSLRPAYTARHTALSAVAR